jgi:hypothetical protein
VKATGNSNSAPVPAAGAIHVPVRPGEKGLPNTQLYNLESDIGEKTNVQDKNPEIVAKMTAQLEQIVANGRSTPGDTAAERRRSRPAQTDACRKGEEEGQVK